MSATSDHLFVYGTLMPHADSELGADQRRRLEDESEAIGAATVRGELYDTGRFPAVVLKADGGSDVHGVLLWLEDSATTLDWLDAYEDIDPARPEHGLYRRVIAPVSIDGKHISAWLYAMTDASAVKFRRLPSGRWTRFDGADEVSG